jgi:putative FmdB family regulatory protein
MPIFEYKCEVCDTKFDVFLRSQNSNETIQCESCSSENVKKLMSAVSSSIPGSPSKFYNSSSEQKSSDSGCGCVSGTCGI